MKENLQVFELAAMSEVFFEKMMFGYERKTTFSSDLTIAEYYGKNDVIDTYNRVMKSWIDDIEFITEFVMALNIKSWEHHAQGNDDLSKFYADLYYKADSEVISHYKDNEDALLYYYRTTD